MAAAGRRRQQHRARRPPGGCSCSPTTPTRTPRGCGPRWPRPAARGPRSCSPTPRAGPGGSGRPTSRWAARACCPTDDLRGGVDADGAALHVTVRAVADELAAAAELVKGKADGVPAALVRGAGHLVTAEDGPGAAGLVRFDAADWFATGTVESVRAALGCPPGTPGVEPAPAVPDDDAPPCSRGPWPSWPPALRLEPVRPARGQDSAGGPRRRDAAGPVPVLARRRGRGAVPVAGRPARGGPGRGAGGGGLPRRGAPDPRAPGGGPRASRRAARGSGPAGGGRRRVRRQGHPGPAARPGQRRPARAAAAPGTGARRSS